MNLDTLLKTSQVPIQPSLNFEGRFWKEVTRRQSEPRLARIFRDIEWLLPMPNLAQAAASLLTAVLIGGASGFISEMGGILQ